MGGVIADAERALDHDDDPRRGPDVAPEPVGLGALGQERGELGPLLGRQAMGRTRGDPAAQGFSAPFPRPLQPLADRALGDPQRRGDIPLLPAPLGQLPRPEAAPLAQIGRRLGSGWWHTRPTGTSRATFTNSW
jgi:hypothetical protein